MKTSNLADLFETITSAELSTASGGANDGASDAAVDAKLKFPGGCKPNDVQCQALHVANWRQNLFRPVPAKAPARRNKHIYYPA